ncbi:hypothetical protein MRX96_016084 [Rhipicephalus microplus]
MLTVYGRASHITHNARRSRQSREPKPPIDAGGHQRRSGGFGDWRVFSKFGRFSMLLSAKSYVRTVVAPRTGEDLRHDDAVQVFVVHQQHSLVGTSYAMM